MAGTLLYRTGIAPEWVDYNGHLRDAYYWLIVSFATDALMDQLGLDGLYRERTRCTLYTVEAHIHYLREVKQSEQVEVNVRVLDADAKRIHAAFELRTDGHPESAAGAEVMLLHVQQGETVTTAAFPAAVADSIARLRAQSAAAAAEGPGSRQMGLRRG